MWRLVHQWSFLLLWLSFDCFWWLVHCWYSLGSPVTIGTPMVIFAVLTVFDCFRLFLTVFDHWYIVGTLLVQSKIDLWRLVHRWFWMFLTIGTVYHSSKTVKRQSKQQKSPLVYQSSHVYQDCTNSVPIVKNSQKQSKDSQTAKMTIGVSSHVYTESSEYTKSASAEYTKPLVTSLTHISGAITSVQTFTFTFI